MNVPTVAFGASTGGPAALGQVLRELPRGLTTPILIAQHIEEPFLEGLVAWLSVQAGRKVSIAEEGARLQLGEVLVVRTARQPIVVGGGRIRYRDADPRVHHQPCIDHLFESLSRTGPARGVAALLTGMGSDGARGLLALRRAGWSTAIQDFDSSAVDGMPRAAAKLGAAHKMLPLDWFAAGIANLLDG